MYSTLFEDVAQCRTQTTDVTILTIRVCSSVCASEVMCVCVCVCASEVMHTTVTDNTILGARACGVVWWWTHTVEEPCGQLPGSLLKIAPVSCWYNRAMIFIHQKL